MNCDPCLKFEYKIIRRPRRIGRNIFSVAAELNMIYNGEPYLYIEDLCIIDFICQLYRFSLEKSSCNVIPVDCQDKIFCNNRNRRVAITHTQAYAVIRRACSDSGIEGKISCHSLRKTFGYHAWRQGVPPVMLMNIYNHSSFQVTMRYLGIEQDDRDKIFCNIEL